MLNQILLKFTPFGPVQNKSALVQVKGDKLLAKPTIPSFVMS